MGRKLKYSKEEKIKACLDYENGHISFKSIALSIGTTKEFVRRWYLKYKEHGLVYLKRQIETDHIVRSLKKK